MKIIFVTHGETVENAGGVLMGQAIGGELSQLGKLQAQELANALKDTKIDYAYSSDLNRAVQTANEILKYHKDLRLTLSKEIRERSFGSFQGKTKSEVGWQDRMTAEDHADFEPMKELYARIEQFLIKLEKQHRNDTVLLVAHRNVGLILEAIVRGIPVSKISQAGLSNMKTGGMKTFDYAGKSKVTY